MSFDINPPSRNLSNVQASHKSSDGGAGNTGYFQREQKEENEFKLEFAKDTGIDSFEKTKKDEEPEENLLDIFFNFISSIIDSIKKFFGISTENKEESKKD